MGSETTASPLTAYGDRERAEKAGRGSERREDHDRCARHSNDRSEHVAVPRKCYASNNPVSRRTSGPLATHRGDQAGRRGIVASGTAMSREPGSGVLLFSAMDGTCAFTCHPGYLKSGMSCVPFKLIFISSETHDGKLGGLTGADAECEALATWPATRARSSVAQRLQDRRARSLDPLDHGVRALRCHGGREQLGGAGPAATTSRDRRRRARQHCVRGRVDRHGHRKQRVHTYGLFGGLHRLDEQQVGAPATTSTSASSVRPIKPRGRGRSIAAPQTTARPAASITATCSITSTASNSDRGSVWRGTAGG